MGWTALEYTFGGPETILVLLSDGRQQIEVLAELAFRDNAAVLSALHVQGGGPNTLGPAALRALIRWAKEILDVERLHIEGATRTSGAGPGRLPRPVVV